MEQAGDVKSALDKSLQLEEILVSEKVTKLKKRKEAAAKETGGFQGTSLSCLGSLRLGRLQIFY